MSSKLGRMRIGCGVSLAIGTLGLLSTGAFWAATAPIPLKTAPPLPPIQNNGYDDYVEAARVFDRTPRDTRLFEPDGTMSAAAGKLVARHAKAIELVRRGNSKPSQALSAVDHNSIARSMTTMLTIARLMMADSGLKYGAGRFSEATSDMMDVLEYARGLRQGGDLFDAMLSETITSVGTVHYETYINRLKLPEASKLLERLKRCSASAGEAKARMRAELHSRMLEIAKHDADPRRLEALGKTAKDEEDPEEKSAKFSTIIRWRRERNQVVRQLEEQFKLLENEAELPQEKRTPVQPRVRGGDAIKGIAYAEIPSVLDDNLVRRRIRVCVLAIRVYQLQHGKLPASLADLRLEEEFTTDPFTGEQLKYVPDKADYLLYSVGYDFVDDGGVPANILSAGKQGDLGISMYNGLSSRNSIRYIRKEPSADSKAVVPHMKPPVLPNGASGLYN